MIDVVVVKALQNGNIYYLSPNSLELKKGDKVIFVVENGELLGVVSKEVYKEKKKNLVLPLLKVIKLADDKDLKSFEKNKEEADKALVDAKKMSKSLDLEMNFVDAYYYLDKSQLVFSFLADTRIDFRELAKKLAGKYKTRIELRQVGVRDKAKSVGGLGPCGLFLCCNTFLTDFNSVSINMAKNQMLALNPTKINGSCGRLLCCLSYEDELYTELRSNLPDIGSIYQKEGIKGKVINIDILRQKFYVQDQEENIHEVLL